jgi:hypothetical protein
MPELNDPAISETHQIVVQAAPVDNPNIPRGTNSLPLHPISLWPVGTVTNVLRSQTSLKLSA